ncbi:MAG TPA: CoB--CoM heterodisulfide reductase iron-sulfur subunit B family protein [Thermodesulfobacteriota bacterium]|nr:CoB--CoM heterodisulfide reductase iron-sulfur subunit B family protein [Thermodesulfobacteriota bacterium]
MKYAYFPGCSLSSSGFDYDLSLKYVAKALDIELVEVKDWVCCGASSAHATSHLLSIALPVLNLSHAEKGGLDKLIAPCLACLSRFKAANVELEHDADLKKKIDEVFDYKYQRKVKVYHPLEVFLQMGAEKIRERLKRKLTGLKAVCYYGCVFTRPPKICQFDQVEDPQSMDTIVRALGVETLDWSFKTECCGVSMTLTRSDMVLKLSNDILREAKETGAKAIVVACPLCQANLDGRQRQIEETYKTRYGIPILYFTQLMGLAFGAYPKEVGLQKLITSPQEVLEALGLM